MVAHSPRLIFKDPQKDRSLSRLMGDWDWFLAEEIPEDLENKVPFELIWESADGETTIHYIDDLYVKFPYIVVLGNERDKIISLIQEKLDVYTKEELLELIDSANTQLEKKWAVSHLGVGVPSTYDQDFFARFQRVMADEDPEVRRAAIWMFTYVGWPELRPLLEQAKENDPHHLVRQNAESVLAAFDSEDIS